MGTFVKCGLASHWSLELKSIYRLKIVCLQVGSFISLRCFHSVSDCAPRAEQQHQDGRQMFILHLPFGRRSIFFHPILNSDVGPAAARIVPSTMMLVGSLSVALVLFGK